MAVHSRVAILKMTVELFIVREWLGSGVQCFGLYIFMMQRKDEKVVENVTRLDVVVEQS